MEEWLRLIRELEWSLLRQLLERLPAMARLRLDANAGWDRAEADRWMEVLADDPRLRNGWSSPSRWTIWMV